MAAQPFTEWVLHVSLLHSRPIRLGGRRLNLPAAREHREHHAALNPVLGGDRLAGTLSGLVAAYAILLAYEWTHFLIHSPYIPRGRYYRHIRRSHRLHHYKNERSWFGVTSNLGDAVIGTNPDAAEVPRSKTARSLPGG